MALRSKKHKPWAKALRYDDIVVGKIFRFTRTISPDDVAAFAGLTGDYNPLHLDASFARTTPFGGTIVHGMLTASLFSTFIGMVCPGRHALILKQELRYIKPVRPGFRVTVTGKVIHKVDAVKTLVIETAVIDGEGRPLVEGTHTVKVIA